MKYLAVFGVLTDDFTIQKYDIIKKITKFLKE